MMASANKFLRIYYASVKAYLDSAEHNCIFLCFASWIVAISILRCSAAQISASLFFARSLKSFT